MSPKTNNPAKRERVEEVPDIEYVHVHRQSVRWQQIQTMVDKAKSSGLQHHSSSFSSNPLSEALHPAIFSSISHQPCIISSHLPSLVLCN